MDLSDIKHYTLLEIKGILDNYEDEMDAPLKMFRSAVDRVFRDYGHHYWDNAHITQFKKSETAFGHVYEFVITNEDGNEKYIGFSTV